VDVPGYGDARGDRWCGAEALDVAGDGRGGVEDGVLSCQDVDPSRNQIHHTQCGAGALADDTFRRRYAQRIGANEADLREHAILDPAATVTSDVERLRSAPAISRRVTFSGHVYDVVTGLVQTILPARSKDNESPPAPTTTDGMQIGSASS
jgi:hypothetical protein